jgi:hypothetical protein
MTIQSTIFEENNQINDIERNKLKICILLHIGYENNYIDFYIKFIQNLIMNKKYIFLLHVTITNNLNHTKIIDTFKKIFDNIHPVFEIRDNYGADLSGYIDFILNHDHTNYDYLIKLHTKSFSYWTFSLLSIFMDLDSLIQLFIQDSEIGIIGHNRYLQPFYFGLSNEYKTNLSTLLQLFGLDEDIHTDYLQILNKNHMITKKKEFDFNQSKRYLEYRNDLYYANIEYKHCFEHFNHHTQIELNHAGYNMNHTSFLKFIAGTIFIQRSDSIQKIKDAFYVNLFFLKEKIEKVKYQPNFDQNGKVFRYTNAAEYILQALIYKFKFKVYGYEPTDFLDNSLFLKNLSFDIPMVPSNDKKKILFVSNELSKTGAPIVLKEIIQSFLSRYDVYLLSYYGGDNVEQFKQLLGENRVFVIYEKNRELGVHNVRHLISICEDLSTTLNPDLVYVNTLVNTFAIYGFYNKQRKIILHIHEAEEEIIRLYNDGVILGYDFFQYVDQIITVNESISNYVKTCSPISTPMVVYNDIHIDNEPLHEEEISSFLQMKQTSIPNGKPIIGGVGSICYRKGFDIFVKLAELYQEFTFVWATNNQCTDSLPANMYIVHCHTQKEMALFYHSITVFILTSRSESFSLALWECLLHKKTVVLSDKTIPLDREIFSKCGIKLLSGLSCVELFLPILDDIKTGAMDLDAMNQSIQVDYIKTLCTDNIAKIEQIIHRFMDTSESKQIPLEYPHELQLYEKLSIYNKFHSYHLHEDLLIHKFNDFNQSLSHYLHNGFCEGRKVYKFPCLIKKRIVFVFHELTFNGATKVGLDIANNLQHLFDVIVLSWDGGDMIKEYVFENKPIVIGYRNHEHDFIQYLERVEFAKKIITQINPDIMYINSSVSHDFYHASLSLHLPCIYHNHEGTMGYENERKGKQIPIHHFCKYYKSNKTIFYSASLLTTQCIKDVLGVNEKESVIKEFQTTNTTNIDHLKNQTTTNMKLENKKIIGMVGTQTYRKGYDTFKELAKRHTHYYFCWVGCDIQDEIQYNDNFIYVKHTNNPYKYMKQFDYFLCTSREDIFGMVILESLYLNIPTILLQSSISSWKKFDELGAFCLDYEYNMEIFTHIITHIDNYKQTKKIDTVTLCKKKYDITVHIKNIINDITFLTNGILGEKNKSYYYHKKYGYMTYDSKKIHESIALFHAAYEKKKFNYDIYKHKYNDLSLVLTSKTEYENHWNQIGYKKRNCEENDWKLFLCEHPHLLYDGIDSQEKLDAGNYPYTKIVTHFDVAKYIENHEDLKKVFHDKKNDAHAHFIRHGCWEGRTCF